MFLLETFLFARNFFWLEPEVRRHTLKCEAKQKARRFFFVVVAASAAAEISKRVDESPLTYEPPDILFLV